MNAMTLAGCVAALLMFAAPSVAADPAATAEDPGAALVT